MMKINLLIILILGFGNQHLQAQKTELDWQAFTKSSKVTTINHPVNYGTFTAFKITNINKFLYKVAIEGKVFELQTPMPTELQALFRLKAEDIQKLASNEKSEKAVNNLKTALPPMIDIASNPKVNDTTKIIDASIKSKLQISADNVVRNCKDYLKYLELVSQDVFTLKQTRNKLITIAQMDIPEKDIDDKVALVTWPIPNLESNYNHLRDLYRKLDGRYDDLRAKAKTANLEVEQQNAIEESLNKVEQANDLIEEEALLGVMDNVGFLYDELSNPNNFITAAPPIQMDGDMVVYSVSITPAISKAYGAYRSPMNFEVNIPTIGGLKVDFSVGPVISFGKNAKDDKFYPEQTLKTDTSILRQRSNNNTIVPSVAAMMHFYSRGSHLGAMMGVGAGLQSTTTLNANLFFGASYIMGKRQKVLLSGGLSYLQVERLKDSEYLLNKEYNTTKIDLSGVTEKVFKPSVFLAISYNLTNKVEVK